MPYYSHFSNYSQFPPYENNSNNYNNAAKIHSSDMNINIINDETFQHNEKYFRPSKITAINIINFRDKFNYSSDKIETDLLPNRITLGANEVIINFFSILREANQGAAMNVGCGSIGDGIAPYPIAYALLSKELQNQLSYKQFLKLFENIYHINLIAIVQLYNSDSADNNYLFLVEIETLEGNSFHYYYTEMEVKKENSQFKINSLTFHKEDFFCAAYHGWQHNAELVVSFMYGDWCKLVEKQYPTQQDKNIKKIIIDATDGNQYMFVFFELTNGTDIAIGQYKKINTDQWLPVSINPFKCIEKNN